MTFKFNKLLTTSELKISMSLHKIHYLDPLCVVFRVPRQHQQFFRLCPCPYSCIWLYRYMVQLGGTKNNIHFKSKLWNRRYNQYTFQIKDHESSIHARTKDKRTPVLLDNSSGIQMYRTYRKEKEEWQQTRGKQGRQPLAIGKVLLENFPYFS